MKLKLMTDDPNYLYEKLIQETCMQVEYTTIQISCTRNMADDKDDTLR